MAGLVEEARESVSAAGEAAAAFSSSKSRKPSTAREGNAVAPPTKAKAEGARKGKRQGKEDDDYERDSDQPEELSEDDLRSLLLQGVPGTSSMTFPPPRSSGVEKFSVAFSYAALDGWVRQDSPSCAAASVAGACNALMGRSRRDAGVS